MPLQMSKDNHLTAEDGLPTAKRCKLSLSLKRKATETEWFEFVDEAKTEALSKRCVPRNMEKKHSVGPIYLHFMA